MFLKWRLDQWAGPQVRKEVLEQVSSLVVGSRVGSSSVIRSRLVF